MKGEIYNIADMTTEDKGATVKLKLRPAWRVVFDAPRVWRSHRNLLARYGCASPGWVAAKLTASLLRSWLRMRCGLRPNDKVSYHADNAGGAHEKDTNDK